MQEGASWPATASLPRNTKGGRSSSGGHRLPGNQRSSRFEGLSSLSGRQWQWPETAIETAADLAGESWLEPLLQKRGLQGAIARSQFFQPALKDMCDPAGIRDMQTAVERILRALDGHERVCVYGDYDVDGVCASSVVADYLERAGMHCDVYIPDRRAEGYGLNGPAMREIAQNHSLMITVDCGSTSVDEIAIAKNAGLDVIVVDHHQVGASLPEALAILNPHRPDCSFSYSYLCATGVAFLLVVALRRALRLRDAAHAGAQVDVRECLDLVAVATVADMVPLTGLNRILVAAGLERLRRAPRPGLAALMRVAGVAREMVSATDVGFRIGPRINARGRLSHAGLGVNLMRTRNEQEASAWAEQLDAANQERRSVETRVVAEAIAMVERERLDEHAAIVVGDAHWHPGVLGLVASRLSQRFSRPAVVVGEGGKGSGRSVDGINLHECLSHAASVLERFGGHPAAAGVTLPLANVDALRRILADSIESKMGKPPYTQPYTPELELTFACMHLGTVRALSRFEPFGRDNPDVLFAAKGLFALDTRRVGDTHLKMRLCPTETAGAGSIDAIAFGQGHLFGRLPKRVDVLFHLERSVFRGLERVQVRVVDLRASA